MAKIEMDISEYEVMRENKKLLEDSLKNERELQKQIEQLTKEKINVLEDAKMKVVKITKTEVTECLLKKRVQDTHSWRQILMLLGVGSFNMPLNVPDPITMDRLQDVFFERTTAHSMPIKEVTLHGLDEIKKEIREELESKMDSDTKRKLKDAEKTTHQNYTLIEKNKKLNNSILLLTEVNKTLSTTFDNLTENVSKTKSEIEKLNKIKEILKNGIGIFNKSKLLVNINNIINEKN